MEIVIPNGNEKEFIDEAVKLGYSSLCFFYEKKVNIISSDKIKIHTCTPIDSGQKADFYLCHPKDELRNQLKRKSKLILTSFEDHNFNDFLHQRNSGLNDVILQEAKESQYAIDFRMILSNNKRKRAQILGRILQNVRLCRKYGIPIGIATFCDKPKKMRAFRDLEGFGRCLGFILTP